MMTDGPYYSPRGGLPAQTQILTDRAMFTDAYAVIPKGTYSDIVTSFLPHWTGMRMWVIARPLSGFAETFSHYIVELVANGGSQRPETDETAQAVLFVTQGEIAITIEGVSHTLTEGGYAYIPPAAQWTVANTSDAIATFHWIRKSYEPVDGVDQPTAFVTNERDITALGHLVIVEVMRARDFYRTRPEIHIRIFICDDWDQAAMFFRSHRNFT